MVYWTSARSDYFAVCIERILLERILDFRVFQRHIAYESRQNESVTGLTSEGDACQKSTYSTVDVSSQRALVSSLQVSPRSPPASSSAPTTRLCTDETLSPTHGARDGARSGRMFSRTSPLHLCAVSWPCLRTFALRVKRECPMKLTRVGLTIDAQ